MLLNVNPDKKTFSTKMSRKLVFFRLNKEQSLLSFVTLFSLTGCLGGGVQIDPPFFLIVIQIYNIWHVFVKLLGSTSIICKNAKFAKFQISIAKSIYWAKYCTNCNKLYIFEKPLTQRIQSRSSATFWNEKGWRMEIMREENIEERGLE